MLLWGIGVVRGRLSFPELSEPGPASPAPTCSLAPAGPSSAVYLPLPHPPPATTVPSRVPLRRHCPTASTRRCPAPHPSPLPTRHPPSRDDPPRSYRHRQPHAASQAQPRSSRRSTMSSEPTLVAAAAPDRPSIDKPAADTTAEQANGTGAYPALGKTSCRCRISYLNG